MLARVPRHMQGPFRGRKNNYTQNVMAAVDFDLKFTYVLSRWEGSAHDALVLADAIERDGGLSVPEGNKFTHSQISQIVLKPLCSVLYANPPLPCWEILSSGCWLCL